MSNMKLKPNAWRLIWRFLILLIVLYAVFFLATMFLFIDFSKGTFYPIGSTQIILLILVAGLSIVAFIPAITSYYYTIEDKYFVVKKYGKTYEFSYENIIFIDEENSEKKKMVIFYSKTNKMNYLFRDANNVLYPTLLKKCKNLMSKEEFYRSHPEER